ncbi:MAG: hypothetical protein R3343_09240 [Nitriliruptorales bacterium]|nr:hypothetical protein [Nitriliruptorales bacterium]
MNDGERLAAYLVGDLDPAERRELEARLERDPALRARLERIRRTDDALGSLPRPEPRSEFSVRLRDELRRELAGPPSTAPTTDELAARRRERERWSVPRWLAPLGAAAAGLALFAVIGIGLTNLGGDDDADMAAMNADTQETTLEGARDGAAGPVVVALGRDYTEDDVTAVFDHPAFAPVVGLSSGEAEQTAETYGDPFGIEGEGDDAAAADAQAEGDTAGGAAEPPAPERLAPLVEGDATDEELAAVQRCLPQLYEQAGTLVPVYAEIAAFEGQAAIVYGLVAEDPETGEFSQLELWVVSADTCEVLFFTQR